MVRRYDFNCADLYSWYAAGESTTMIAQRYGCSPTSVANALRRCGVELRPARFVSITIPHETLHRLYLVERLPMVAIARYFGVSTSTIGNKRRLYGIPARDRKQR